jgi:DNA-binding FrmR family transcriptional regulator
LKKKFDDESFSLESDPYETVRQLTTIKGAINSMITSYVEHYAKGHMIEQIKNSSNAEAEVYIDNLLEIIKVYGK